MGEQYDGSYFHDFIINNPIPARCKKCKRTFVDGELFTWLDYDGKVKQVVCNEAIRAPTLSNCRCFYCWGELAPLDVNAYARRLETLHLYARGLQTLQLYREPEQQTLTFEEVALNSVHLPD